MKNQNKQREYSAQDLFNRLHIDWNDSRAFNVMGVGCQLIGGGAVATLVRVDLDYQYGNGGKEYKIKVRTQNKDGIYINESLATAVETDEFGYLAVDASEAGRILRKFDLKRTDVVDAPILMLEAGIAEATCYRLNLNFAPAPETYLTQIETKKADVWRGTIMWKHDTDRIYTYDEARKYLMDVARETWNSAMYACGITDNWFDDQE